MSYLIIFTTFVFILCGLAAAFISYRIEYHILQDILRDSDPLFAQIGALVFEVTKICTIILYRHSSLSKNSMPLLVQVITWFLRTGFIIFALFCALTFFSKFLTSPNLESVKEKEKVLVTEKYAKLKDPINLEISRLQKLLTTETGITRADGSFVGPRYTELNNLLTSEKNKLENHINSEDAELQKINNKNYKDYENNEAIRNKTISDLALVVKDVSGWELKYAGVIFFLTILTALLIEFSIWVTFEHIIVSGNGNEAILKKKANKLEEENKLWSRITDKLNENYQLVMRHQILQSLIDKIKPKSDKGA